MVFPAHSQAWSLYHGSVFALGEEKGVPTPTLDTLASIVKGHESQYIGGAG